MNLKVYISRDMQGAFCIKIMDPRRQINLLRPALKEIFCKQTWAIYCSSSASSTGCPSLAYPHSPRKKKYLMFFLMILKPANAKHDMVEECVPVVPTQLFPLILLVACNDPMFSLRTWYVFNVGQIMVT